jgi:hypothetical protein
MYVFYSLCKKSAKGQQTFKKAVGNFGSMLTAQKKYFVQIVRLGSPYHRAPTPLPPSAYSRTGKNNLNEEITALLPTAIGERFSQTI